jgi:hypothetical protein
MNRLTPIVAAASLCTSLVFLAPPTYANVIGFTLNGPGVSANGTFAIEPNISPPDPNPNCGTLGNNPCRSDPPGAYRITNVTGIFSDAAAGIVNASILGLVPTNPENERDPTFDPLVPASLSFIPGTDLSFNNLFFPNGSPIDCAYPFFGTFLDVFGTAFTIDGGYTVDFWGDGNVPGLGLTYGVAVTDGTNTLDYQFQGISATAPEPATIALLGAGLGGIAMRRRRKQAN